MKKGLAALFERADCQSYSHFNLEDADRWEFVPQTLPFVVATTAPQRIICPGCEEACLMPTASYKGSPYIWCDKPQNYGRIELREEALKYWKVGLNLLAETVASLLETGSVKETVSSRIYDLGVWEGSTLFLIRGVQWEDANALLSDSHIRNSRPVFITLLPAPQTFSFPSIEIEKLLNWDEGRFSIDVARLSILVGSDDAFKENIFRKEGDIWRVFFEKKQAAIKNSKGMQYIDYLLHHPNEEVPAIRLQAIINKTLSELLENTTPQEESEVVDAKTKRDIQNRIDGLKLRQSDSPEITQLENYLRQGTFQGKSKRFTNDNERARQAVTQAITSAEKQIAKYHGSLANHLKANIQKGGFFKYTPASSEKWK